MAPSRRQSNGRSPLVNQQRQITSFFSKSTSPSPSPSPILSNSKQKLNPNTIPDPSPSPTTPSPRNPKPNKPLLLIGGASSPSPLSPLTPPPSLYGQDVVGTRIKVYWPLDKAWYEGIVKSFDELTAKHLVQYDDDEEESLDLSKEKIEWLHESVKKLKRLRRGFSAFKQMVIEDDEVEESHGGDDSSDEDWGKNEEVVEDAADGEEDMELEEEEEEEEDEEEVAKGSKGKQRGKVEPRKRKLGEAKKLGPAKKSKSGAEVGMGGFKVSSLEPTGDLESK